MNSICLTIRNRQIYILEDIFNNENDTYEKWKNSIKLNWYVYQNALKYTLII